MQERDEDVGLWLQTYSGLAFFPLAPHPDQVAIEDIAHALSLQCRFAGHTREHYSVAQHSVLVSRYVPAEDALWGLFHDAAEAYLVDLPRPLKHYSRLGHEYRRIEARAQRAICERFQLQLGEPASIAEVERRLLWTERRDLMAPLRVSGLDWGAPALPYPDKIQPWADWQAELEFMLRFGELMGLREAHRLRPTDAPPRDEAPAAEPLPQGVGDGVSPPQAGGRAFPPAEDAK